MIVGCFVREKSGHVNSVVEALPQYLLTTISHPNCPPFPPLSKNIVEREKKKKEGPHGLKEH
jgi:hypothetical protein